MDEKALKILLSPLAILFLVLDSPETRRLKNPFFFSFYSSIAKPLLILIYYAAIFLLIQVILYQIDRNKCRNTLFLHGDTVQNIGRCHGTASVGDNDEL